MGLFLTEDGHFQGWLAAFLCCCAAVSDDESPYEKERSRRKLHTESNKMEFAMALIQQQHLHALKSVTNNHYRS